LTAAYPKRRSKTAPHFAESFSKRQRVFGSRRFLLNRWFSQDRNSTEHTKSLGAPHIDGTKQNQNEAIAVPRSDQRRKCRP
jgi:hypothetical protein